MNEIIAGIALAGFLTACIGAMLSLGPLLITKAVRAYEHRYEP